MSICRTAYGTTFGVPFINTHTKLHKAMKMSAKQAAEMCTPKEVPEDVHFELLFDDQKSIGMSGEISVNLLDMIVSTISGHYLDFLTWE